MFIIVFVDDIPIYSYNEELLEKHQRMTLDVLRENQLYSKFTMCDFLMKEFLFLGHIIFNDGVTVDPIKVAAVMEWKQLKNLAK